jgi:hypothetical protein
MSLAICVTRLDLVNVFGDLCDDGGVDSELLLAHQGFTGKFQQNALVGGRHQGNYIFSDPACCGGSCFCT